MKIVHINSSTVGSTGKIMRELAQAARDKGHIAYTCSAVHGNEKKISDKNHMYISNIAEKKIHVILGKYTGLNGCFSHIGTYYFLKKLKKIAPDIIHFHNLHNCYINLSMLMHFIEKEKIPVVWTLHDCWPFTGHCAYFDTVGCEKWKSSCFNCPQLNQYPYTKVDKTEYVYSLKKRIFDSSMIKRIVTPSAWLKELVEESFLKKCETTVINNGINTMVFKPTDSDFRNRYDLNKKFILLGVAHPWVERKGYDVFLQLRKRLGKEFAIVLIGMDPIEQEDEDGIIRISRTNSQTELAEVYSTADVLINPTRQDNFPTVHLEALACGTPVVTFNTGGSGESIDTLTGTIVDKNDVNALEKAIYVCKSEPFNKDDCLKRSELYTVEKEIQNYLALYEEVLNG